MPIQLPDVPGTPPLWRNQQITLYHGTTEPAARSILRDGVYVRFGNHNKDFGQGFYTTTKREQAARRARNIRFVDARRREEQPKIVVLVLDRVELAQLCSLTFVAPDEHDEDFWSFVRHCRRQIGHHALPETEAEGRYDAVYGPVVMDWQYRKLFASSDQVSFHTERAQGLLNSASVSRTMEEV